jgi:hypothetical protein
LQEFSASLAGLGVNTLQRTIVVIALVCPVAPLIPTGAPFDVLVKTRPESPGAVIVDTLINLLFIILFSLK